MDLLTKAHLLFHIARWRLTWNRKDIDYRPDNLPSDRFITAREAARLIKDNATVFSSGMAANTRCSIFFWALREEFEKRAHPINLTWIVVGAQGSRGRAPGTLEELDYPGLITRFIAGHAETVKALLRLAQEGRLELHTMPQGVETFLLEAQARGEKFIETQTGVGTFLDPRVGNGTYVGGSAMTENFVEVSGDKLKYHFPPIDYSLFVGAYADIEGNIYMTNTSTYTESYESSLAVKKNGGTVIASVSEIIPKSEKDIYLPADKVDYIVVNPDSEQTGSVKQRKYWPMFTVNSTEDVHESVEKLRFANNVLKITPVRTPVENAMGRLAASLFTQYAKKGALVNIGVGLPEEVSRLVYEGGLHEDIEFFTETGVLGGLPTPGIFFGAAINPKKLITSAQIFHMADENLDMTVLGLLEVDSQGNVNVSKRGDGPINYVGPGGFPDLTTAAKNIIFIGSWMAHAKFDLVGGKIKITKAGSNKFKAGISEITFNGQLALKRGTNVLYVTNVGVFKLTDKGMCLVQVMPGVDIKRDILDCCEMKVVLPKDGNIPVVPPDIVTGKGFKLTWPGGI